MARRTPKPPTGDGDAARADTAASAAVLRVPKDEAVEAEEKRRARRLTDIAIQQLEWAHQRTREAMEDGKLIEADAYSESTATWMALLTGRG